MIDEDIYFICIVEEPFSSSVYESRRRKLEESEDVDNDSCSSFSICPNLLENFEFDGVDKKIGHYIKEWELMEGGAVMESRVMGGNLI